MIDQRRVRFSTLGPLRRPDLPLIVEVWREDAVNAPWASRESMKLAGILASYVLNSDQIAVGVRVLENNHNLLKEDVRRALSSMTIFGLVEAFSIEGDDIRVALRLSSLQLVRILEMKRTLATLTGTTSEGLDCANLLKPSGHVVAMVKGGASETSWVPDDAEVPRTATEAPSDDEAYKVWLLQRVASALRDEARDKIVRQAGGSARLASTRLGSS
ncbi:MAG: hypothetical protein AB7E80_13190 [Hyphomicrobiaceae bacterium]